MCAGALLFLSLRFFFFAGFFFFFLVERNSPFVYIYGSEKGEIEE
jgi:hypothetical protein